MRKSFLTLAMGLSALAMSAVNVGDPSGHYLYARLDGAGNWGQTNYQFCWANTEGTKIYLNVPDGIKANGYDLGFVVSDANQAWSWNKTIVGAQKSDNNNNVITWEQSIDCYYGGNGNFRFPGTDTFKSIVIDLPTNTSSYNANNGNPPVANAGKLTVSKNEYKPEGLSEDTNEYADYWLRGKEFGNWAGPSTYRFRTDENGVIYYDFGPAGKTFTNLEFAVSGSATGWPANTVLVPGSNEYLPLNQEAMVFHGGNHNAKINGSVTITRIEIRKLPTNDESGYNFADGNKPAEPAAETAGVIYIYGNRGSVVDSEGKSKIWLQVWDESVNSTPWDTAGGLFAPIKSTDSPFYSKYVKLDTKNNTQFLAGRPASAEMLRDADPEGKALPDYDAKTQIVRYHKGANVYYIDFTEFDPDGLLLRVPVKSDMNRQTDANKDVPMILRSGIRFGVLNDNYSHGTDDKYRYLKYGRYFRLNEIPMPMVGRNDNDVTISFGDGQTDQYRKKLDKYYFWNGRDTRATDFNNDANDCSTYENKIGDNRLLSEYNIRLNRIIFEVVNEGDKANEQVYLRFEGRYDFTPVASVDYSYSFADSDIDAPNHRGDEPNIFSSATYRWYDRAFTRFYANEDATLHGCDDAAQLAELTALYGLPEFRERYDASVEYNLLNAEGNDYEYIDIDGDNTAANNARYSRRYGYLYGQNGWGYYMTSENGKVIDGPTKMPAYNFTEHNEDTSADATRKTILGKELSLVYDHKNTVTLPSEMVAKITYHFLNEEPNNVPTYEQTPVVNGTAGEMGMNVKLTGEPRYWSNVGETEAKYKAELSIAESDFLHVDNYVLNSEGTYDKVVRYAPIKRWEFRADLKDAWTIMDEWLPETSTYNASPVTSTEYNGAHGSDNDDTNAVLNVVTEPLGKRPTAESSVDVTYRADAVVRRGRIISDMLLTEAALQHTDFVDENGKEVTNIYATDALKGHTLDRAGSGVAYEIEETQLPAHVTLAYSIPTGIESVDTESVAVNVNGRTVSANGLNLAVYNVAGALVANGTEVTVPAAGIYVVKADSNIAKIIVK